MEIWAALLMFPKLFTLYSALGIVINESPQFQIVRKVTATFSGDLGWVTEFKSFAFLRRQIMEQVSIIQRFSPKFGR